MRFMTTWFMTRSGPFLFVERADHGRGEADLVEVQTQRPRTMGERGQRGHERERGEHDGDQGEVGKECGHGSNARWDNIEPTVAELTNYDKILP